MTFFKHKCPKCKQIFRKLNKKIHWYQHPRHWWQRKKWMCGYCSDMEEQDYNRTIEEPEEILKEWER